MKKFSLNPRLFNESGFTLVELIITVAILGILLSIAVPMLGERYAGAREETDRINVELLQGAVNFYYRDHGVYPSAPHQSNPHKFYAHDREHELVEKGYLPEIPASPFHVDPGYLLDGDSVESLAEGVYYD